MTATESQFWRAVRELAAMRRRIPDERRAMSGVRQFLTTTRPTQED